MPVRVAAALLLTTGLASAQDGPQSAIPWLTDTLTPPPSASEPAPEPLVDEPIATLPLNDVRRDAAGLVTARATGLPQDGIAGSDPARIRALIQSQPVRALPALQDLAMSVLLAELQPPDAAADGDPLFAARIDALIRRGAVEQAQALLEHAGAAARPETFARWFDAALLTGRDADACATLRAAPGLLDDLAARAFCLTRGGDWDGAVLILDTAEAVGALDPVRGERLEMFMLPELFDGVALPPLPNPPSPLLFRLADGVGEAPPTRDLPLAFAVADLQSTRGWKTQLEAAERLARAGALDANRLLALYTAGRPSASGGVWDRAGAVQALDRAVVDGDAAAIGAALGPAVAAMEEVALLPVLADLYGEALIDTVLCEPDPGVDAWRLALLGPDGARAAATKDVPDAANLPHAAALLRGDPIPEGGGPLATTVAEGFATRTPMRPEDRRREVERALEVALTLAGGAGSDPGDIAAGLSRLRSVGMDPLARRVAVQMLLL
ncbi:hypothetical protein [Jannaschia sp. LMIT008]|uniref:hypothetical protein n=1 Tax=Jannaschia maritima TaxID=3032585 RepID=UPI002811BD74|nr:hypothetical protein [Jannaschia sp. LMIT008]